MSSFYRKQMEAWLRTLDVKADRVLDVGGAQVPVKGRTKSWEVGKYEILDLEEPHKTHQIPDYVGDLNHSSCVGWLEAALKQYDVVFCLEVMEYIWHPWQAVSHLARFVRPEGTLYITFPFVYPQHEPIQSDFLRYTRKGAEKLLVNAGFRVDEVIARKTERISLRGLYASEAMRAAKEGVDHEEVGYIIKATKTTV